MRQRLSYLVTTRGVMHGGKRTQHSKKNLVKFGGGPSCCGAVWLVQVLGLFLKLRVPWIQLNISKFLKIMFKNLSQNWSYAGVGCSSKTTTLKHCSKSTKAFMQRNKYNVLEWPSQSPDLNIIENLWDDLKRAVHARQPSNLTELEMFCKEEWSKIPSSRNQTLIRGNRKRLEAVIFTKGGCSKYWCGCPNVCTCLILLRCIWHIFCLSNKPYLTAEIVLCPWSIIYMTKKLLIQTPNN